MPRNNNNNNDYSLNDNDLELASGGYVRKNSESTGSLWWKKERAFFEILNDRGQIIPNERVYIDNYDSEKEALSHARELAEYLGVSKGLRKF